MAIIDYYVATSLDGFICDKAGGIDMFTDDPVFVEHYQEKLKSYAAAIMGKNTYTFGYQFGLKPGDNPYPWMDTYVFSKSLSVPEGADIRIIQENWQQTIKLLKDSTHGTIYLCGGGVFSGFVLESGLIDRVSVKLNPFVMGEGVKLFESARSLHLEKQSEKSFESGIVEIVYNADPH